MEPTISRRQFVRTIGAGAAVLAGAAAAPAAEKTPAASKPSGAIRFGVQTAPQHVTYQQIADIWKLADELGYDSAFTFDHFMPIFSDPNGSCFEGWSLLAALAAQTRRVKVGVLVTGNIYRYPIVVAKMAATVDHVSNGRLILGMGAGWYELESTAYGMPFYTVGGRAHRLGEALQVMKLLFTQERSTFAGKYYQLVDAPFEPKTVQRPHPPILVGGVGPKLLQPIVARYADIWNFFADPDVAKTKALCEQFDGVCRQVGRDPAQIEKSAGIRAQLLDGPPKEVRARLQALVDIGVRHFIISLPQPYEPSLVRSFAKDVMPVFRGR
jgi:F420-dependent oxidoreductase-like protein